MLTGATLSHHEKSLKYKLAFPTEDRTVYIKECPISADFTEFFSKHIEKTNFSQKNWVSNTLVYLYMVH